MKKYLLLIIFVINSYFVYSQSNDLIPGRELSKNVLTRTALERVVYLSMLDGEYDRARTAVAITCAVVEGQLMVTGGEILMSMNYWPEVIEKAAINEIINYSTLIYKKLGEGVSTYDILAGVHDMLVSKDKYNAPSMDYMINKYGDWAIYITKIMRDRRTNYK